MAVCDRTIPLCSRSRFSIGGAQALVELHRPLDVRERMVAVLFGVMPHGLSQGLSDSPLSLFRRE
jgi:hypothetical protein